MDFNVSQLLKSPVGTVRRYDVDASLDAIEEYRTTAPVRGHVKLTRTPRGVLVEANLETAVRLECSRCLDEIVAPLHVRFHEEFLPTVDVVTGLPLAIPEGNYAFTIDDHHILDLHEPVRQYALLGLPMQPLCRPNCAGLCPVCGRNWNYGRCGCRVEPADSRLAALVNLPELLQKQGSGSSETQPR